MLKSWGVGGGGEWWVMVVGVGGLEHGGLGFRFLGFWVFGFGA